MSYFTAERHIRPELLDQEARDQAKSFIGQKPIPKETLSSSQLRRFYNEFKQLKTKYDNDETKDFAAILPLIKMQKSKSAYAANPKNPKIPKAFHSFIEKNVDSIQGPEDFKAFMLHFEAVVGFFYAQGVPNN
ncbi:MAG: type III-A CRISPR-associated protein Csm2 [Desulfovermiculus sp.]